MLKIWGRKNSVNVKKALWAAEELGLKYERIDAGMEHGVTKTPEYLAMNPTSLVPTIEDDGFVLWESHAVVRYLAANHGMGTLCPADPQARASAERWMDWTHSFSREFQRPVFWPLVRTPPEQRDMKAVDQAIATCMNLLKVPEQYLANTPYLAGTSFTMGDIPLGCHIQLWYRLPIARPKMPGLDAWFQRLLERPLYRKIVDLPPT
jgi:glutathione S-transferase